MHTRNLRKALPKKKSKVTNAAKKSGSVGNGRRKSTKRRKTSNGRNIAQPLVDKSKTNQNSARSSSKSRSLFGQISVAKAKRGHINSIFENLKNPPPLPC